MTAIAGVLGMMLAAANTAPVPGQCTAPAAEHVGEPGCYLSADVDIATAPAQVYWHLHVFPDAATAEAEAARHPHAKVVTAHQRVWLHMLGGADEDVRGGVKQATVGPLAVRERGRARLLESWFPPGMITRAHSHPGPEVFYVVDGEQCVETPQGGQRIGAGEYFVVEGGPHLQAAPRGRRSVVLLLVPDSAPWMALAPTWTPTGFCEE